MSRWLFVVFIVSSGLYFFVTYASVCRAPLSYELVALDERFNLSKEEARETIAEAEAVWEKTAGRELFYQSEEGKKADIEISFIFDERQEKLLAEEALRETLDTKEDTTESLTAKYEELVAEHKKAEEKHATAIASYEKRLAAYNAKVESYNAAGGAPEDVYNQLEAEKGKLAKEQESLNANTAVLKKQVEQINAIGEQGNRLIEQYNQGVSAYNKDFGEPDEFTQGDYQDGQIHVYTFTSRSELVNVLSHEFGHSLDIGHVEGSESIMYYLMEDQPTPPQLSATDEAALVAACGESGTFITWLRSLINTYL